MPQITATAVLQVLLLLSAVPAQYLISRWSGSTVAQRYHATTRKYIFAFQRSLVGLGQEEQMAQESPPIETMLYDNDQGFFGGLSSKTVRSPRPPYVFLRVGEVVMERKGQMVGVVVSWDPELQAPPEWIDRMYSSFEKTPHYKVLFSGPGPSSLLVAYLPQTQLARITGTRVKIPTLENYFTHFDGQRFIMKPWLRELFPEDEIEDE
uniref:Hemimethylated DNA-binding domain-containing protein n=1 Tax=Monopterus albus TaxID=43700 RepID=A0A3Q3KCV0_MONAL